MNINIILLLFYFICGYFFFFKKVWLFNFFVPIWIFCFYGKIKLTYFSSLYTIISHHQVNDERVDWFLFQRCGAIWTNSRQKYNFPFKKSSLKLAVHYLLENIYFTLRNKIDCRQLIGIPTESDPPPFMANLFLDYYENKLLLQSKKRDPWKGLNVFKYFSFVDNLQFQQ